MDPPKWVEQLRRKFVPSGSVIERAVKSGVWEGGTNSLNRFIQLAKVAILARLLPPREFGLLGIGFLTLAIFESFSQLGINQALIQQNETNVDDYLDTTWVLQILRGLILTIMIFLLAPYAASWFNEPRATNVIRVLGIGPLLLGLKNPGVVYFRKNLEFHLRFMQIISGSVVNFITAITLGILLGNVWALVAGSVAGNIVSVLVSFSLHDYRPKPKFDPDLARELIDFGKWIFGGAIADFLQNQGDDVFVGWFLGTTPLAFYQMAYRFSNAPATELTSVISKVTFPSLSQVQNDAQKLRNGYFRTLRFSVFLAFPAAAGIILVAPSFVRVFLGTDWLPTIPIMQALAVWGALRALGSNNRSVWFTLSRPDIGLKLTAVRILLIAAGIFPAANRFGVVGVAAVLIVAGIIVAPIGAYVTLRLIDGSIYRYLRNLIHPFIGTAIMTSVLFLLGNMIPSGFAAYELLSFILIGMITYFIYVGIATSVFNYRISDDIGAVVKTLK